MIVKKKSFWVVFIVILLIVTLLSTVGWYRSNRLEGDVRATLEHKITELTNGFYRLEIEDIKIALYNRNIHVKGITLKPDSVMFAHLQKHDSLPDHYPSNNYQGSIPLCLNIGSMQVSDLKSFGLRRAV